MPIEILMPALSPTMESGTLAKWLVKEGDSVAAGDVIAEIETDKATMEFEAVDEGVVGKIVVAAGSENVAVNAPIAVLLLEGEDASSIGTISASASTQAASAPVKPVAQKSNGSATSAAPASTAAPAPTTPSSTRIFASPLARRIAKERGIDLTNVSGSGPHGRIVQRDVEYAPAITTGAGTPSSVTAPELKGQAATPLATGASDKQVRALYEAGSFTELPHDNMRKTIARRLTESKQTVPHFYLSADCRIDALLATRQQINAAAPKNTEGKPAYKISVNDMVIKAYAMALRATPDANAVWSESAMLKFDHVDIGVAVAIPGGLITPVIRKAETLSLTQISAQMKDFATRARERKLQPQEYQGGAAAISNLGMYGIPSFSAIINPPHATILAVGAGIEKFVPVNGAPELATMMTVTLSTDHRVVDGALGAELLRAFKELIEQPLSMLV